MADGAGGLDARLETLAAAVMDQNAKVAEMTGRMKSFIDFELAGKQRLEIRVETQGLIKDATNALEEKVEAAAALADKDTLEAARKYTDEQVAALVEELASREERDQKMEARIRASIWGVIGVGTTGVVFALYQLFANGGV